MKFSRGNARSQKSEISNLIRQKKKKGKFIVIDVGGSANSEFWGDVTDFMVDINAKDSDTTFNMDICEEDQWKRIKDYVEKNGKFDYCICSHTLEDIYNPYLSLRLFPTIAKMGVIMVPYYTTELSNVESKNYLGYIHHRYLFKEKNGKLFLAPKMPFLERFGINKNTPRLVNFTIEWEDSIKYEVFMGNYFVSCRTLMNAFREEFPEI